MVFAHKQNYSGQHYFFLCRLVQFLSSYILGVRKIRIELKLHPEKLSQGAKENKTKFAPMENLPEFIRRNSNLGLKSDLS